MDHKAEDPPEGTAANPVLKANMAELRGARSIEQLRQEMHDAGIDIGTGTLHRAVQGQSGNRLASLEKIATFFGVTADQLLQPHLGRDPTSWPFSPELYKEVSTLPADELQSMEGAMWSHLRKPLPDALHQHLVEAARRKVRGTTATVSVTEETQPKRNA